MRDIIPLIHPSYWLRKYYVYWDHIFEQCKEGKWAKYCLYFW